MNPRARVARLGRFLMTGLVILMGANLLWMWRSCEALSPMGPGKQAPDFTLAGIDGREVSLEDLRGKVVVLSFWASWCAPCLVELPILQRVSRKFADRGLVVVAVNLGEPAEDVKAFLEARKLDLPVVLDEGSVAESYWVDSLPALILIDRDGVIRGRELGVADESHLAKRLEPILSAERSRAGTAQH